MSQWTYRSGSFVSAGNATGNALSINKPTGTASGDLLVFSVYWESDTNTVTGSSSLVSALKQTNPGAFLIETFYKIAGGSEPATYTFTPGTNGQWRAAVGAAYSAGTGSGPWIDVSGGSQADSVIVSAQTAPSVTTTGAARLVTFNYGNFSGTDSSSTTGFATNLRGSFGGVVLADAAQASAGATGTSRPNAGPGTESYAATHIAFISDSGGAPADPFKTRQATLPSPARRLAQGHIGSSLVRFAAVPPVGEILDPPPTGRRRLRPAQDPVNLLGTVLAPAAETPAPTIPPIWGVPQGGYRTVSVTVTRPPGAGTAAPDPLVPQLITIPGRRAIRVIAFDAPNLATTTLAPVEGPAPFKQMDWPRPRTSWSVASVVVTRPPGEGTPSVPAGDPFTPPIWAVPGRLARRDVSFRDYYLLDDTEPFTARQTFTMPRRRLVALPAAPANRLPLTDVVVEASPFFGNYSTAPTRRVSRVFGETRLALAIGETAPVADPFFGSFGTVPLQRGRARLDALVQALALGDIQVPAADPFFGTFAGLPVRLRSTVRGYQNDGIRDAVPLFTQLLTLPAPRRRQVPWTPFWPNLHGSTLYEPPPPPGSADGAWSGLSGSSGTTTVVPHVPIWRGWR